MQIKVKKAFFSYTYIDNDTYIAINTHIYYSYLYMHINLVELEKLTNLEKKIKKIRFQF